MDEAEILHRFKEHEPKDAEVKMKLEAFEMEFASIALMINRLPTCREQSLALTSLEESAMWVRETILRTQNR
jgi:hypothetical protein